MKTIILGLIVGLFLTFNSGANPISGPAKVIAQSNNQFAFELYQSLKQGDQNLFISPYSIHSALAMTYEGAQAETAKQMQTVLHFPIDRKVMHQGYSALNQLYGRNQQSKGFFERLGVSHDIPPTSLRVANALWADQHFEFKAAFVDSVEAVYDAQVSNLSFANTESARQTINDWVEDQTEQKIKNLIPFEGLSSDTKLVLTNAIYFKADWAKHFNEHRTEHLNFHLESGIPIKTPMMQQIETFGYCENETMQVLRMHYRSHAFSMLVLLPKQKKMADFEQSLSFEAIEACRLSYKKIDLMFPKFKLNRAYSLKDPLMNLGMTDAFSQRANFLAMSDEALYIDKVFHKTFIEVEEKGTEAAAATAVVVAAKSAAFMVIEPEPIVFHADHPFIFMIQDNQTQNILFMGRIMNPNK